MIFNLFRFIKSHYAGKRAAPGSHSSRAYIETRNSEKSEYGGKSSALSDTSEAPSLGMFLSYTMTLHIFKNHKINVQHIYIIMHFPFGKFYTIIHYV